VSEAVPAVTGPDVASPTAGARRLHPDDAREALAEVAGLYYLGRLDQHEVAARVGVSRSTVSRMLTRALDTGIVEIRVHRPVAMHGELQSQTMRQFPVRDAIISHDRGDGSLRAVGRLTADYLQATLPNEAGVAVGWGTALRAVVDGLCPDRRRRVDVVQLIGAVGSLEPDVDGGGLAAELAELLGGRPRLLNVPLVVADPALAAGLRREPSVARVLEVAARADIALIGLGSMRPESSSFVRAGYVAADELAATAAAGAVGDVCGHFLDADGQLLDVPLGRRTLGLDLDRLRAIPRVVGVAAGPDKVAVVRAALRGGLVNVIATDSTTMAAVLDLDAELTADPAHPVRR
jgi:DNA-binding transcriptional regulator LsrR (DeoR family)